MEKSEMRRISSFVSIALGIMISYAGFQMISENPPGPFMITFSLGFFLIIFGIIKFPQRKNDLKMDRVKLPILLIFLIIPVILILIQSTVMIAALFIGAYAKGDIVTFDFSNTVFIIKLTLGAIISTAIFLIIRKQKPSTQDIVTFLVLSIITLNIAITGITFFSQSLGYPTSHLSLNQILVYSFITLLIYSIWLFIFRNSKQIKQYYLKSDR
jgi:hypothetical protein